ncbi:site-specific DNA-methyltransferase [Microbacterium sp. NPDC089190]|uniref:DNA-methyltransferase n=1 Tax=Microbacterium sp. NPDC089190 TaxID=3155063 RepID=UPI00344C18A7
MIAYQDEFITLVHGKYQDYASSVIGDQRVDAIVTDPPYGETSLIWDRWVDGWLADAAEITDSLWCWGSFRMFQEHAAEFAAHWKLSQDFVWEKHNGSGFHADRFKRVHELAAHWYRGDWAGIHHVVPTTADAAPRTVRRKTRPTHTGHIEESAYVSEDGGPRLMRSVQYARSEHGRAIHPTQKPLGVLTPLIEYSVPAGGLVVDLFSGSGSVALAARQSGRRCIAFEVSGDYIGRSVERLSRRELFEGVHG